MTVRGCWQRMFGGEASVAAIRRYRVLLGLWTVVLIGARLPYLEELYALPVLRAGWVTATPPIAAVVVAVAGVFVGVALMIAGRWPRVGTALVLVCFGFLAAVEVRAPRAYVVLALVQWLLVQVTPTARTGEAPRWGTRLVMLQFSAMYAFAAVGKLLVADWRTGEAVVTTLQSPRYGGFLLSAWLPLDEGVWPWAIAWGTIVGELFIAVGLWWARTRRLAIAAVVGLHLGIAVTLRVSWLFHALMLLHLVLFVRRGRGCSGQAAGASKWTSSRLARRRRATGGLPRGTCAEGQERWARRVCCERPRDGRTADRILVGLGTSTKKFAPL